jgi:hypothetical protein
VSERRLGEPRGATGYGDRPLTFQWQSPLGLVGALGVPAARNGASGRKRSGCVIQPAQGLLFDWETVPSSPPHLRNRRGIGCVARTARLALWTPRQAE